jgi:hypothetical protein
MIVAGRPVAIIFGGLCMVRRLLVVVVGLGVCAGWLVVPAAAQSLSTFTVMASATAEVPTPGPVGATADATLTIDASTAQLCYRMSVVRLPGITEVHLHRGASGVDGPMVAMLDMSGLATGTNSCTKVSAVLARAVIATPSGYYLNVHTSAYPAGAVRGQLRAVPDEVNAGSGGLAADPPRPDEARSLVALSVGLALGGTGLAVLLGRGRLESAVRAHARRAGRTLRR